MKMSDRLIEAASLMITARTPLSDGNISDSDKNEDT